MTGMSLKGSDGVKAVGLVVLIIILLGFTAFRLMGGKTEAKNTPVDVVTTNLKSGEDLQKVAATPHVTTGMSATAENGQVPVSTQPGAGVAARNQVNPLTHDPFRPPAGMPMQQGGSQAAGSIGMANKVVNGGSGGAGGTLPKFGGGGTVGSI